MDILFLVILGFIQGLTEFLPVSSSGHLVLLSNLFGLQDSLLVSIVLHLATLLSIVFVMHKQVFAILRHPFGDQSIKIAIATVPTGVLALVLMPLIERSFSGGALPFCFLFSAGLLVFSGWLYGRRKTHALGYKDAFIIGVFQGLATFPGISRSGATISGGLICGVDKEDSASFSFLISIPIIILSMFLEMIKIFIRGQGVQINIFGLICAFIIAFLIGIIAIQSMMRLTQRKNLNGFALYLIFVAFISIFI